MIYPTYPLTWLTRWHILLTLLTCSTYPNWPNRTPVYLVYIKYSLPWPTYTSYPDLLTHYPDLLIPATLTYLHQLPWPTSCPDLLTPVVVTSLLCKGPTGWPLCRTMMWLIKLHLVRSHNSQRHGDVLSTCVISSWSSYTTVRPAKTQHNISYLPHTTHYNESFLPHTTHYNESYLPHTTHCNESYLPHTTHYNESYLPHNTL